MTQFWRLELYLAHSQVSDARACVNRLERLSCQYFAPQTCAWSAIHFITAFARARLAAADNRPREAAETLRELQHEAETKDWNYLTLTLRIELSKALAANHPVEALQTFCDLLKRAASAGIQQLVLDGGPQVGRLLLMAQENARRTGQSRELLPYVEQMLGRWRERYDPPLTPNTKPVIAELLSSRERNIINLIAHGQSNKEIARGLGIAPETVKSHVKHIFVKLDVSRRTRAVARAQSLGIVGPQ
jgi:LuxR family maltose regulon positive regulatory protein